MMALITKCARLLIFIAFPVYALEPSLDRLVTTLKSKENVNIHITQDDGVLISWATFDPRRVDNKTLSIIKMIGAHTQQHPNIVVDMTVFSDAQATRLSNQSMTNTEYKARRIEDALKEEVPSTVEVSAVGLGSEIPYNLIFASIHAKHSATQSEIVAVPVRAR